MHRIVALNFTQNGVVVMLAQAQVFDNYGEENLNDLTTHRVMKIPAREAGEKFILGVFCSEDGSKLGDASLMDGKSGVVFIGLLGYWFYNQHWGKGYVTGALNALIEIAFSQLNLHKVEAAIEPDNFRPIRVAEKAGLRLEGLKKKLFWLRED